LFYLFIQRTKILILIIGFKRSYSNIHSSLLRDGRGKINSIILARFLSSVERLLRLYNILIAFTISSEDLLTPPASWMSLNLELCVLEYLDRLCLMAWSLLLFADAGNLWIPAVFDFANTERGR